MQRHASCEAGKSFSVSKPSGTTRSPDQTSFSEFIRETKPHFRVTSLKLPAKSDFQIPETIPAPKRVFVVATNTWLEQKE